MTNDNKITKYKSAVDTILSSSGKLKRRCVESDKKKKEAEKKIVCTRGR